MVVRDWVRRRPGGLAESRAARGPDNLDRTQVRPSAEAGLRQAATVAADLYGFWNGASPGR